MTETRCPCPCREIRLSVTQRTIMEKLRETGTADVEGSWHLAVKTLSGYGLVSYARMCVRTNPPTPGGMVWTRYQDTTVVVYRVRLTDTGKTWLSSH